MMDKCVGLFAHPSLVSIVVINLGVELDREELKTVVGGEVFFIASVMVVACIIGSI